MDSFLKEALEIVKAQASVRKMTEEEITSMVKSLAGSIGAISNGDEVAPAEPRVELDVKKSIKEKSIVCLECGKSFKILTKRHLNGHGLTPEEYKDKYGLGRKTSLVCKGLARDRRKKMSDMKLWEKRVKNK